ncbi:hypothetical protein [Oceanobacter mangrovi]|uniref:hypothetical protein n=1 Tax=Oceanobacter mangrovi TaxID=2862510 RepID=UPI001C8EE199|nr:hypothetical protein [Oceanobacter mangrovi]
MSETAEERSKRVFLGHLLNHEWTHQITVFYNPEVLLCDLEVDEDEFFNTGKRIRERCRRKFPGVPSLWRIQAYHYHWFAEGIKVTMPYWTAYVCGDKAEVRAMVSLLKKEALESVQSIKSTTIDRTKVQSAANAIKRQKSHDFKTLFPITGKINRFHLINEKSLVPCSKLTTGDEQCSKPRFIEF